MRRSRRRLFGILFSLCFTLGLLEIALRLVPPPRLAANWLYDPVLGHRGPRSERVRLVSLKEPAWYDSYGFRSGEPDTSPGRHTVFLLGDSITEAVQVPWEQSFAKLLEATLPAPPGKKTQVVAWASSDYGTADELLTYATVAKPLPHDVVALEFLGLNDFVNNTLAFAGQNRAMSDFARPYLIPESELGKRAEYDPLGDGMKFTYPHPLWKTLREHVRLFAFADFVWHAVEWYDRLAATGGARLDYCPIESQVFLDDGGPEWKDAYEVTARLAKELRRQADSKRPAPRLVAYYVPSFFELSDPDWNAGLVLDLTRCNRGSYHRENPEKRFFEIFRGAGIEAVSLREDLVKSGLSPHELYLPDGHFTPAGHRVVARALLRLLRPDSRKPPETRAQGPEPR